MKRGDKYFEKRMNGRLSRLFYATWIPPRENPKKFFLKYINKNDYLLDMGCSIGSCRTFKEKLNENHHTLDLNSKLNPTYIADAQNFVKKLKLNNKFDVVMSIGLLEHIQEPQKVVRECYNCLKSGGHAIHWVPFIYRVHASYGDYWRFTSDGLKYLFRDFKEVEIIPTGGFFSVLARMFNEATAPLKDIGFFLRILAYPFFYFIVKLDKFTPQELYCRGYYIIAKK